tara:strand:+ start:905 stop:1168 length:264 start_codon:yes stop_codon:yes gene_type:complete
MEFFLGVSRMSFVIDIFVWLLIETIFGFIFYTTGGLILKILTLGQFKIEFHDFASFKKIKSKKINLICLVGISFYVLSIVLVAYLNN